jgi:HAD superfamily hydrolase (TIGR01549 family)
LEQADPIERERVQAIIRRYEDDAATNAPLNDGAREFLDWVKERKLPVAIVTRNTRRSVQIVCRRFSLDFDHVYTREDGPHKPSPAAILAISKRWNIPPTALLMVGDYKYDIEAGIAAGAHTALLTNGKQPKWAHEAEFVVHRLTELIPILLKSSSSSRNEKLP